MKVTRVLAGAVAVVLAVALAPTTTAWSVTSPGVPSPISASRTFRASLPSTIVLGQSVRGRAIVAQRQGAPTAAKVLLVLGQMHGSEPRGRDVVREVRALKAPAGVQVWTISTMNPDGAVLGTRRNARGVDLNRNFPDGWLATYTSRIYYPGPYAASEPETGAMTAFLSQLRPDLVVSLHQAFNSVDIGNPKSRTWALRLARALGLPTAAVPCSGPCAGTLTGWYNKRFAGVAVTVELPPTVPTLRARAYARGIFAVGALLA